jgi:hypothetical protein
MRVKWQGRRKERANWRSHGEYGTGDTFFNEKRTVTRHSFGANGSLNCHGLRLQNERAVTISAEFYDHQNQPILQIFI